MAGLDCWYLALFWPILGWVWGGYVWAKDYELEPGDFIPFLVLGIAGGPLLPIAWEACRWTERKRDTQLMAVFDP